MFTISRLRRAPRSDRILMLEIWRKIKFLELFATRFLASEFGGKIFVFFNKKQGASSYRPSLWPKVLIWDENQFWSLQPFMKWIKDRVLHLHFLKD